MELVTIEIDDDEALVLFEFLQREINDRRVQVTVTIEHPAEFWALNGMHGALETKLATPFDARYRELLAAARDRLVAQRDPDGDFFEK